MAGKLKVLDLLSGIGGRVLGFQQAGFDVICAVDNNLVCKDIYCQVIDNKEFIVSDIENVLSKDLPDAEVIIGKLVSQTMRIRGKALGGDDSKKYANQAIANIIFHKNPKAFVLEIPTIMITHKQSSELRHILELREFLGYTIYY